MGIPFQGGTLFTVSCRSQGEGGSAHTAHNRRWDTAAPWKHVHQLARLTFLSCIWLSVALFQLLDFMTI